MKISGIYQIQSKIKPDRIYIGSGVSIKSRWNRHVCDLRYNRHPNKILQNHYNKYGESDLQFSVLLGCEKEDLIKTEQYFIDSYNPYFNICKIAGNRLGLPGGMTGKKHKNESKIKMSESAKKRGYSLYSILKMKEVRKNTKPMLGKKHSEETKRKMSDIAKGKHKSAEHAQHIKESWIIRKLKIT